MDIHLTYRWSGPCPVYPDRRNASPPKGTVNCPVDPVDLIRALDMENDLIDAAQPHAVRLKVAAMLMARMTCALWLIMTSQVNLSWRIHRVLGISLIADGSCNGRNPDLSVVAL